MSNAFKFSGPACGAWLRRVESRIDRLHASRVRSSGPKTDVALRDLKNLQFHDRPRIEIDPLLEYSRQMGLG